MTLMIVVLPQPAPPLTMVRPWCSTAARMASIWLSSGVKAALTSDGSKVMSDAFVLSAM